MVGCPICTCAVVVGAHVAQGQWPYSMHAQECVEALKTRPPVPLSTTTMSARGSPAMLHVSRGIVVHVDLSPLRIQLHDLHRGLGKPRIAVCEAQTSRAPVSP
jgi:hypothetical protein